MEHPLTKKVPETLSSVKNAAIILTTFSLERPILKVSELNQLTGISKSTISRTLQTLVEHNFVKKEAGYNGYRLGFGVLNLAGIALNSLEVHQETAPLLTKLVAQTGEAAHIAIIDDFETIYLHKEETQHLTSMKTHLGKRNPVHCTSSGKVLLAFAHAKKIDNFLHSRLKAFTAATITNPILLRQELEKVKRQGFAQSFGEMTPDVNSVAAPIRDYTGNIIAAITIVGPKNRMTPAKMNTFTHLLLGVAKEASENLGYYH